MSLQRITSRCATLLIVLVWLASPVLLWADPDAQASERATDNSAVAAPACSAADLGRLETALKALGGRLSALSGQMDEAVQMYRRDASQLRQALLRISARHSRKSLAEQISQAINRTTRTEESMARLEKQFAVQRLELASLTQEVTTVASALKAIPGRLAAIEAANHQDLVQRQAEIVQQLDDAVGQREQLAEGLSQIVHELTDLETQAEVQHNGASRAQQTLMHDMRRLERQQEQMLRQIRLEAAGGRKQLDLLGESARQTRVLLAAGAALVLVQLVMLGSNRASGRPPRTQSAAEPIEEHEAIVAAVDPAPDTDAASEVPQDPAAALGLLADFSRKQRLRRHPQQPTGRWNAGLATLRGNVRKENQDFGASFSIGEHQVQIIADGCGGLPHGRLAAATAGMAAAEHVTMVLGRQRGFRRRVDLEAVAADSIQAAADRLAKLAEKRGWSQTGDGLRTTLIVVISDRANFGFGYIGDGGGWVLRSSGELEAFLTPQKASPDAANVLAASLGPTTQGAPVHGSVRRQAGDLLLIGSDGVFDRVNASFAKDVLRAALHADGDLQNVADAVVEELAEVRDQDGYLCDDNLTLGLLADGSKPELAEGFWDSTGEPDCAAELVSQNGD